MPLTTIDGLQIHFERRGDEGEPLVFVHGYTGDLQDWRHQLAEFGASHRVLAIDLRGHGRSQASPDRDAYSILRMADDVEQLIAEAGFERYHLAGHSMGGAISQEIALRSPGRLMSLTLEDTGHTFGLGRNERYQKYIAARFETAEKQGMAAVAEIPSPIPPPPHLPPGRREEERLRLAAMSVDAFIGAWQGLNGWAGTKDRCARIAAPTLVVYGALDVGLIAGSKYLAATIPGAELVEIPEAAHSPQLERPGLFNAPLRRHLQRNAGATPK
jgi:pimeloyl-ACP methyl ester carboxylesterase